MTAGRFSILTARAISRCTSMLLWRGTRIPTIFGILSPVFRYRTRIRENNHQIAPHNHCKEYVEGGEHGGCLRRGGAPVEEHGAPGVDDDRVVGGGDDGADEHHHEIAQPAQPRAGAERVHVPAAVHPSRPARWGTRLRWGGNRRRGRRRGGRRAAGAACRWRRALSCLGVGFGASRWPAGPGGVDGVFADSGAHLFSVEWR